MQVTVTAPHERAAALIVANGDPSRALLGAVAWEAYRSAALPPI
jgi:hypothetical protein